MTNRNLLAALFAAALWITLSACVGGDPCRSGPDPQIELGQGVDGFEELADPPTMDLVFGPQGGVHLEVALRGRGVATSEGWAVELEGRLEGEVRASAPLVLFTPDCADEGSEVYGVRLIFDNGVALSELDAPLEITGRVIYAGDDIEVVSPGIQVVVP